MDKNDQYRTPLVDALTKIRTERIVPFDVPGHKRGRGNRELTAFLGKDCVSIDVNSMKMLDNLCQPYSVIKDAESLTAQAFGAAAAFFMVGGTTSCVQAMILSCVGECEKIIMPRNVHRSAINALILSGALPVYIDPKTCPVTGISLGMSVIDVERVMDENPDAKAVFLNNPTYYGICSDIRTITQAAHLRGMKVLVDEAHGTHFYFNSKLPVSAMAAGADMAAVSMHKSGGSLTQSSLLLLGSGVNAGYVRQVVNLTQTTSGSYLLMSSLDLSRKRLATEGEAIFDKVIELTEYARGEINSSDGYYAFSKELCNGDAFYDFDITKLVMTTSGTGLTGLEIFELLLDEYDIQIEFGDIGNILAYVSVGDNYKHIERLLGALESISLKNRRAGTQPVRYDYLPPIVALAPRKAFYSASEKVGVEVSTGRICSEFVMCYPPGIPLLAPGEVISPEIVSRINNIKRDGSLVIGPEDSSLNTIKVIKEKI